MIMRIVTFAVWLFAPTHGFSGSGVLRFAGTTEPRTREPANLRARDAGGQEQLPPLPPIGIIDFYGLHNVSVDEARAALHLSPGDSPPSSRDDVHARLMAIHGVAAAHLELVCCDSGKSILYVGIQEHGARTLRFRKAPTGSVRLPDDVRQSGAALEEAWQAAVLRGDSAEDRSHGHSLTRDPTARAIQERFVRYAAHDLELLRSVLRHSRSDNDRALAAEVIAYARDKRRIIPDLLWAMRDPSREVRNNAVRALAIIADFGHRNPELGIRIPYGPLIDLLNSSFWTDRNKSTLALDAISANRDSRLMSLLAKRALPSLAEMATWQSRGHAEPAFRILGRVAGVSEQANDDALTRAERMTIVGRWSSGVRR